MDELFRGLRHFIARDFVFVIGGGLVVGAFLNVFDRLPSPSDSWVLLVLLAGVSYFVAYALEDASSLTAILTTVYVKEPNRFVRWLYRRFTPMSWSEINIDLDEARERVKVFVFTATAPHGELAPIDEKDRIDTVKDLVRVMNLTGELGWSYVGPNVLDATVVCKQCKRDLRPQPTAQTAPTSQPQRSSRCVGAVLSLVIPSAGQMYLGRAGYPSLGGMGVLNVNGTRDSARYHDSRGRRPAAEAGDVRSPVLLDVSAISETAGDEEDKCQPLEHPRAEPVLRMEDRMQKCLMATVVLWYLAAGAAPPLVAGGPIRQHQGRDQNLAQKRRAQEKALAHTLTDIARDRAAGSPDLKAMPRDRLIHDERGNLIEASGPDNWEEQVRRSSCAAQVVILGTVRDRESFLTEDSQFILSDYTIRVEAVLRGDLRLSGDTVSYVRPGGVLSIGDRVVTARHNLFPALEDGRRYVIFANLADGFGLTVLRSARWLQNALLLAPDVRSFEPDAVRALQQGRIDRDQLIATVKNAACGK